MKLFAAALWVAAISAVLAAQENPNFQPVSAATLAGGQLAPIQPPTFIGAVPPPPADDCEHRVWVGLPASRPEHNLPRSYVWPDMRQKSDATLAAPCRSMAGSATSSSPSDLPAK